MYSPYIKVNVSPVPWKECKTLGDVFLQCVETHGNVKCFGTREVFGEENEIQKDGKIFNKLNLGDYKWMNYNEVSQKVDQLSHALIGIGIQPRESVCIFAETRVEWMLIAQACFRINIPIVTLTPTLGIGGIIHGINQTSVNIVITSQDLLSKVKNILSEIPTVSTIIYMENTSASLSTDGFPKSLKLLSFSELEAMGTVREPGQSREPPGPDDIAIIMYTSGSTGVPKGVMISHKNVLTTLRGVAESFSDLKPTDSYIAYLPLAHVLEVISEFFMMGFGVPIGYSSPTTLTDKSSSIKEGCSGDATLLKPTFMATVPLILTRIQKSVLEIVESQGMLKKSLFNFAVQHKLFWLKKGFSTPITDRLIFSSVKRLIGGRVRMLICGSAPLSPDTHDFIRACICNSTNQAYGLTETSAGGTIMELMDFSVGVVGPPLTGLYIRLVDWEEGNYSVADTPYPRGEIVIGGDNIAKGYYGDIEKTEESFKEEEGIRWFYTGDIGEIRPNGNIAIIDRKKDLVKLQFGEYVALGKVEAELKNCPIVENICVYGSGLHSYLIALVVPVERHLRNLVKGTKKEDLSFQELCEDEDIISSVTTTIKNFGMKCDTLLKREIPTKIALCTEEWLPESGLVTAAFKLRRAPIQKFYQSVINKLYGIEPSSPS